MTGHQARVVALVIVVLLVVGSAGSVITQLL
jgi:hypothetical protein